MKQIWALRMVKTTKESRLKIISYQVYGSEVCSRGKDPVLETNFLTGKKESVTPEESSKKKIFKL